MCHHAAQLGAALVQRAAQLQQQVVFGFDAGAVAVGVDLDHHVKAVRVCLAVRHQCLCCGQRIHHHGERTAAFAQGPCGVELVGRNAHGVEDVGVAAIEEDLGLLQRGHRDALGTGRTLALGHWQALGGLDMRPKAHAQALEPALHVLDVVQQARFVDQRGRGRQVIEQHACMLAGLEPLAGAIPVGRFRRGGAGSMVPLVRSSSLALHLG